MRRVSSRWYALLLGFICACGEADDPRGPANVTAEVSENISTVVKVRWTTEEATIGYVEYGLTEDMELNTPLEPKETKKHSVTLLGLTAATDYYYRVVTWDGDDAAASDIATVHTGDLPSEMPALALTGDGHDQFTIVPINGRKTGPLILDRNGKIVWYHVDDRDLQFFRALLSVDGKSLLYNAASVSGGPSEDSEIVRVALDGSKTTSIPIPLLQHDFVEHPDGTLAAIVMESRDFEGAPLKGNQIVEVDPNGKKTTVWSSWDCFDPALHQGDSPEQGWTFANALDFDPADDAYYLSMRSFSSITKIDRKTGECEWVLGATAATLDYTPGSGQFLHEHQFQVLGDRLLVMDNDGLLGTESRVLEFELDLEAKVAKEVWSYIADPSVYTFVLGEPTRLPDGDTFVNWSSAGQMERVTKAGKSIWKVNTPAGYVFGFNTMAESLYPADAPRP